MLKEIWRERISYLFILPILIVYFIFSIYPILTTFHLSFFDSKIVKLGPFVGLKNYADVLMDATFQQAFFNTIVFTFVSTAFILGIALILAVLVNLPYIRLKTLFKIIFFLPVVTSAVATGYTWKWMYDPTFGIINSFLSLFGIVGPNWLSNPDIAMISIIIVNVWKWIGYFVVILIANLQLIDNDFYDAAAIDGANAFQRFFHITVPLLRMAIGLCIVLGIVAFMRAFALVFVMTQGGPAGRTELMVTYVYKEAFGTGLIRIGFSAAASIVLFAFIMAFTLISNRITKLKV
jgi:multiple sugar transport system permease protein